MADRPELQDKKRTRMKPPQVAPYGSRKTIFINFVEVRMPLLLPCSWLAACCYYHAGGLLLAACCLLLVASCLLLAPCG